MFSSTFHIIQHMKFHHENDKYLLPINMLGNRELRELTKRLQHFPNGMNTTTSRHEKVCSANKFGWPDRVIFNNFRWLKSGTFGKIVCFFKCKHKLPSFFSPPQVLSYKLHRKMLLRAIRSDVLTMCVGENLWQKSPNHNSWSHHARKSAKKTRDKQKMILRVFNVSIFNHIHKHQRERRFIFRVFRRIWFNFVRDIDQVTSSKFSFRPD